MMTKEPPDFETLAQALDWQRIAVLGQPELKNAKLMNSDLLGSGISKWPYWSGRKLTAAAQGRWLIFEPTKGFDG